MQPQLRVFLFVLPELSATDFRPLKQTWVAGRLGMQQAGVSQTLRSLVADGLLELGEPLGAAKTYRLNRTHPSLGWVTRTRNG